MTNATTSSAPCILCCEGDCEPGYNICDACYDAAGDIAEETAVVTHPRHVLYQLVTEDAQAVAGAVLHRKLTDSELRFVENKLCDCIGWHEAIENCIQTYIAS